MKLNDYLRVNSDANFEIDDQRIEEMMLKGEEIWENNQEAIKKYVEKIVSDKFK